MANNILQLFQDHISQPEVVKLMGEAFDLACEMAPDGTNHEVLAKAIIAATKSGERDPFRIADAALYKLRQKP